MKISEITKAYFDNIKKTQKCDESLNKEEITPKDVLVYVDLDNVGYKNINDIQKFGSNVVIHFMCDEGHKKMLNSEHLKYIESHSSAEVEKSVVPVHKNAVDFVIIYEITKAIYKYNSRYIYIISGDTGYDTVISRIKEECTDKIQTIERFDNTSNAVMDLTFMKAGTLKELEQSIGGIFGNYRGEKIIENIKEAIINNNDSDN